MRTLAEFELLQAWEDGRGRSVTERALRLLAAALPGAEFDHLARLPIGRRDALLLELRRSLFGGRLSGRERCPTCGAEAEIEADIDAMLRDAPEAGELGGDVQVGDVRVRFRLPDSTDVLAVADCADTSSAAGMILKRCVLDVDGARAGADEALPGAIADAVARSALALDPLAEIRLRSECPACGAGSAATLDIAAYLVDEVDAHAGRILAEVAALGRAYGWGEREVLAMSRWRRRRYLELAD